MCPVGQLDQDDPDVSDHRQQHLPEALGLRLRATAKLNLVEFADAIHQFRDLGLVDAGVFDDVVQERRHQSLRVETQIRQDVRNRYRVGDIRLAGLPFLTAMRFLREMVGVEHEGDLLIRQVSLNLLDESVQPYGALPVRQSGQDGSGVVHGRRRQAGSVSQRRDRPGRRLF